MSVAKAMNTSSVHDKADRREGHCLMSGHVLGIAHPGEIHAKNGEAESCHRSDKSFCSSEGHCFWSFTKTSITNLTE